MYQWLKELLIAISGGSIVLVGMLTILKGLFVKFFTNVIDSSFEKSLEKYRNRISRSNRAYEILLDREMSYYEKIDPIFAELIPLVQDLVYLLENKQTEEFREHLLRYAELIINLKSEVLLHQSYIPESVFKASSEVVSEMQKSLDYWKKTAKLLFAEEYDIIDYEKAKSIVDDLRKLISLTEQVIKHRLQDMSELK